MQYVRATSLCAALLSACAPAPVPDPTGDADACGASGYQALLGASFAAVSFPAGLDMRVVTPGMAVTMDYSAERLNVTLDDAGLITGVSCG